MEAPLFSLVILVCKDRHLLPLTLDSLRLQRGSFEVILLGNGYFDDVKTRYPELSLQNYCVLSTNLSFMMNEGVRLARGKYIQFLEPGDRYISQHGLAYLGELIHKNKEPHLVYSKSSLIRGGNGVPRKAHLDLKNLKKGAVATSPWILKRALLAAGGFDEGLRLRPTLDLLCRLLRRNAPIVSVPRVITDLSAHPVGSFGYARETCRILFRHFGLWSAMKWMFIQDHSLSFQRTAKFLKQAFWRDDF